MSRTSFNDFSELPGTLGRPSPPSSPRRRSHWARRIERTCCRTVAYFPLLFVYGLTTWAVWVAFTTSFLGGRTLWSYVKAGLAVALWSLGNASYTTAVFTSPGSPLDERQDWSRSSRKGHGYEGLPTHEDEVMDGAYAVPHGMTMVTAKSTGKPRYCKKCRTLKPDRTHHCSTCGKCVLKMDHHCPWLATCVGLRNYKAFLLFLVYTSLFCWLCFGVSAWWVWAEIQNEVPMQEGLQVVNTILLAVLGGIIGLVLSCFTGWHLYLVATGQTTIESLEKTRYLAPVRKSLETNQSAGRTYLDEDGVPKSNDERGLADQLKTIHANALPGILREEEGEEGSSRATTPLAAALSSSPARESLHRSYASLEAQREHDRYNAYLDELDSEKLPNAFNIGWKRNLLHVFGEQPLLWALPVCNTSGDGWQWEISNKWVAAREEVQKAREQRKREDDAWGRPAVAPAFEPPAGRRDLRWTPGQGFVSPGHGGRPLANGHAARQADLQMQPLDRRKGSAETDDADVYDTSSDEEVKRMYQHPQIQGTSGNWNDVPEEFLSSRRQGNGRRSRSRGRRKGD